MSKGVSAHDHRMWVLAHWRQDGWSIVVDRLRNKRGEAAIARLLKDGLLELEAYEREGSRPHDWTHHLYRITEAGRAAYEAHDARGLA